MKKNKFVLPDAWYVVVNNENIYALTQWRYDNITGERDLSNKIVGMCKSTYEGLVYSKEHNPVTNVSGEGYDFGQEITFGQFKKYVLGEDFDENEDLTYLVKIFEKLNIK